MTVPPKVWSNSIGFAERVDAGALGSEEPDPEDAVCVSRVGEVRFSDDSHPTVTTVKATSPERARIPLLIVPSLEFIGPTSGCDIAAHDGESR